MKKFIILLTLVAMVMGCRTGKIDVQEEKSNVQESVQILKKSEQSSFDFNQDQQNYDLSSFGFGYNISLESKDSTQPARITEYREGKPFRSLEVVNATYAENKNVKDSSVNSLTTAMNLKFNSLMALYSRQSKEIKELKKENQKIKVEGAKMANNFKYGLWLLLAVASIYIGQSTGLFMVFKRLLKRV